MGIIITIILIIIFLGGAYYMGNWISDGFNDEPREKIINSLLGVLCWCVMGAIVLLCCAFYLIIFGNPII